MRVPPGVLVVTGFCLAVSVVLSTAAEVEAPQLLLTNATQIRQLNAEQAAQSLPVHLQGVIITKAAPAPERAAVIWDDTASIYLLGGTNLFLNLERGDLVDAVGVTDPGEFAPIVKATCVRKVGVGALPSPQRVTLGDLLGGGPDGQWVEISGIVRSLDVVMPKDAFGQWHMELATMGGKVSVVSNGERPSEVAPDARVRVQAVCFYQFTQKRQVLRPMLLVPGGVSVAVEKPAPPNDSIPLRPAGSLLEFSPESGAGHRVHVGGVVTHQEPGTNVWIRDGSGALRIQTKQTGLLRAGDFIDVLGFPKYGSYTPALEDAVFEKRGTTNLPAPIPLTAAADAFDHLADLVSFEDATLVEFQAVPDGWILTLQQNGTTFKGIIKSANARMAANQWQAGSVVRVTGICSINVDDAEPILGGGVWHPQSFQLLIRSTGDLVTLRAPPWWTPRHIIFLLLVLTGASVLITATVMWLARQRLHEQAHRRAMAEAQFAAILAERNRVAREIHDTLAQGLAATSVHLRMARKNVNGSSEPLSHHLEVAQQLVRDSLEEARNSIWNMRSQVLETADLAGALEGILQQMADGTELKCQFQVMGRPRRFAPVLENNILRIGQEAISNAVRHANARSISVNMDFAQRHFHLKIKDDGCGFDFAKPPPGDGGFGLVGMRERTAHINGQLEITSVLQRGTELTLHIPLSGE
jgi:signal transduction histidine kinase